MHRYSRGMRNAILAVFIVVLFAGTVVAQERDPIEGKWWGTAGSDRDRVELGLEFRRNAAGTIEAFSYQPVLNLFGQRVTLTREGGGYQVPEFGATFVLDGDRLEGSMTSLKIPVALRRTDKLPSEQPVPAFPKGPTPFWQTKLGGQIYAPVAVRDGVAYVGTTGGVFNAVKVSDGTFAWTFSAGRPMHGEALVTGDAVYFVCDNGFLFKLSRAGGKELWRYDLGDGAVPRVLQHPAVFEWDYMAPKPAIADGVVYVGSGDGSMHAVTAADGQRVWRFATKAKIRSEAALDANRLYFGNWDGTEYALDRKTGQQVWLRETRAPVTSGPALVGGKLIVGNRGIGLVALNAADGEIAWRGFLWGSWSESTAVPFGDLFYIGASDLRRVTAYDPKDGRVVWRTDVYGWNWGRPLVTEKLVYVGVAGGTPYEIRHVPSLTALDRITGKIVWRWTMPETTALETGFPAGPVLDGKRLVIAALDGMLYAFPVG